MRNTVFSLVHGRFGLLWCMAVLLSVTFPAKAILAGQEGVDNVRLDEMYPTEICKLLTNKTASEKAQIKSREIAKHDFKGEYINTQYGVKVEIIGEVKEININEQSGIELFAKAWKENQQLGFGADGSVEIERFRIFNPPILVDDPDGDIIKENVDIDGNTHVRKLREDPFEAIRQTVAHNVKIVGKENAQIVIGKIGNTTSTFYPDAHVESTSHDAMLYTSPNASWDTVHNAANADGSLDNYAGPDRFVYSGKDGANFRIIRFQTLFDTSAIGSDTVNSATASLYINLVNNGDNDGDDYIAVVSSNPAANTGATVGDYSLMGTTAYSNTIDLSSMSTGDYVDWTINATGLAAINTSGITKFGFREGHDIIDSAYAGGFDTVNSIVTYAAEASGTANDPKLVVVHSAPTPTPTPTSTANTGAIKLARASSQYLSSADSASLSITGDLTIEAWLNPASNPTSGQVYAIVSKYDDSGANNQHSYYFFYLNDAGTIKLKFITSSDGTTDSVREVVYTLIANVWQHVAVTFNSVAGECKFYVNGIQVGATQIGMKSGIYDSTALFTIGSKSTILEHWDGKIDDVRIWNTTRTAAQIFDNMQVELAGNESGLQGYWKFNSSLNDATSNANNLTNNNGATFTIDVPFGSSPTPTPTPSDTTAPSGTISINSNATYTNSTAVTLSLSATDDVGVAGYYLSTSSTRPSASDSGWVSVSSTTSFNTSFSYTLSSGDGSKTLYAWYKDSGGNVSDTASDSIILDTTAPTVTITSPTPNTTYTTTSSTINLGGTASDSTSGVNNVTWSNNRGGNGTANGTTNWSISSISLSYGDNIITVTATDGAGNTGTDTITVTYISSTPTLTPTPSPTPCTDDYEPNNSFSTAYGPLTSGNSYRGKICSASDVDYFTITVESAVTISLMLEVPSNRDYDLYLYNALQNEVAHSQKDTGFTETISYDASTTGAYYIKVIGFESDYDEDQTYTLSGTWPTSDETGDIFGKVTDAKTGAGINGAIVSADTGKSTTTSRQRGQDGAYVLQDVTAGECTVTASASGYASSSQSVTVNADEQERVDFALTSAETPPPTPTPSVSPTPTPGFTSSIEGKVVNQIDGKPITGASVVLDSKASVTKTDTKGLYRFNNVSAGQHKMTAAAKGFKQSEIVTITVVSNQTAHQNFSLMPLTTPTPVVSPTPIPSPTPEVTPTPPCEAELMGVFPVELELENGESREVTITITCEDGVTPVPGEKVKAKIKSVGDMVMVSPSKAVTDVNGQAVFTITAKNEAGKARVVFKDKAAGLKTTVKVKVIK